MSTFYGIVEGSAKTAATRRGTGISGLTTKCNTWTIGVECRAVCVVPGKEHIEVYATNGSDPKGTRFRVGTVQLTDDGAVRWIDYESGNIAEKI